MIVPTIVAISDAVLRDPAPSKLEDDGNVVDEGGMVDERWVVDDTGVVDDEGGIDNTVVADNGEVVDEAAGSGKGGSSVTMRLFGLSVNKPGIMIILRPVTA